MWSFSKFVQVLGVFLLLWEASLLADPTEQIEIQMKDGIKYLFPATSPDVESSGQFSELPEEAKQRFLKNRTDILKMAAQTLHGLRIPIGVWRKSIRPKLDWLYGKSEPIDDNDRNFQETGFVSIQKALSELDTHLWKKSETISNTNEYGFSVELGLSGGGKAGSRGLYGITGLGMMVTVDPIEKAVALEVFGDLEFAKRATPFYGGGGVFMTLMGTALSADWGKPLKCEQGSAFCAAGLVGFLSDRYLGLGVSKELGIGFPGAVLMESSLSRIPLLRVGASTKWPGFIRAKTAVGPMLKKIFTEAKQELTKSCAFLLRKLH